MVHIFKDEFTKEIDSLCREDSTKVFESKGVKSASVVLSKIFTNAKDYLYIYSSSLEKTISDEGDFEKSFAKALKHKIKVKILLDSLPPVSNRSDALKLALEKQDGLYIILKKNSEMSRKSLNSVSSSIESSELNHFVVSDYKMLRYEQDSHTHKSECSFNSRAMASDLTKMFEEAFENAKDI